MASAFACRDARSRSSFRLKHERHGKSMNAHDEPGYASSDDHAGPTRTGAAESPLVIPMDALSSEALAGVIEAFILREGTDYGLHETPFSDKVGQVRRQLESGDAQILFDPESETVHIALAVRPPRQSRVVELA
jgi:hypothetical protein